MCVFGILAVTLMGLPIPNSIKSSDNPQLAGSFYPISSGCDTSNVNNSCVDPNGFLVLQYWRVVWGIPALISVIQLTLMMVVFRYDTPVALKQRGDYDNLAALMKRVYVRDQVQTRMDEIQVQSTGRTDEDGEATLKVAQQTFGDTFCNPTIRMAAWVGCSLSVIQ
jgi:hypothetical protein